MCRVTRHVSVAKPEGEVGRGGLGSAPIPERSKNVAGGPLPDPRWGSAPDPGVFAARAKLETPPGASGYGPVKDHRGARLFANFTTVSVLVKKFLDLNQIYRVYCT